MNTKKLLFKLVFIWTLIFTTNCILQAQDWNQQISGTTENLHDIFFINEDIGWVVGNDGAIRKTVNGGNTWTNSPSGVLEDLRGVYFQNANRGWAVGKNGTILITTDGGASWTPTNNSGVNFHLRSIYFASENNGWIVGDNGTSLKSTDNGITWSTGNLPGNFAFTDIYFKNATTGWVTSQFGFIYRTTDSGTTWVGSNAGSVDLSCVHFTDALTGWTTTLSNNIFKSTDGGENWIAQSYVGAGTLRGIFALSLTEVWGVGLTATSIKTTDGGNTWNDVVVAVGTPDDLNDVFFTSSGTRGWICGEDGRIYRTDIMVSNEEIWAAKGYHIFDNAPNPFQQSTFISFEIPQNEQVSLQIFNANGQLVRSISPKGYPAGKHHLEFERKGLSEGIYFFELKAGAFSATRKMIIAN